MSYRYILICAQIILESFPVSSSGHVILLEHLLHVFSPLDTFAVSTNKALSHFLHGPTAFVLAAFFWDRWIIFIKNIKRYWPYALKIIAFAFMADVITFVWYVLFDSVIDITLFPIGLGFLVSIVSLLSLKFVRREGYTGLTWKKALVIGVFQGLALLPGISRFSVTFVAGCWLGLAPIKSFEFSFAIQWPLIFVGFLKSFAFFMLSSQGAGPGCFFCCWSMLLVLLVSSVIAYFSLYAVRYMVIKNRLWYFAIVLIFSFLVWLLFVLLK